MPVKIRLARHGRKARPFYHIVVADARAPRDGRLIERIGSYNPNTNPATIDLDFDRALYWFQTGAQPTDTARAILSHEGVLMKNHLLKGVKKGAHTAEEAEAKYQTWRSAKDAQILAKVEGLSSKAAEEAKARLDAEAEVNQKRAEEIAKRKADAEAEANASEAEATAEGDEATEETTEA
jgi:small subunit ribosomal protein S16